MNNGSFILEQARDTLRSGSLDTVQLARKRYARLMEPVCRQWELTRNELDVLLFLANNPELDRAADIVALRGMAKSHVSQSVTRLEQRGFLSRSFDPADRRTAHLAPTAAAMPAVEAARELQSAFLGAVFAGVTREELALWHSILEKVCRNIEKIDEQGPWEPCGNEG